MLAIINHSKLNLQLDGPLCRDHAGPWRLPSVAEMFYPRSPCLASPTRHTRVQHDPRRELCAQAPPRDHRPGHRAHQLVRRGPRRGVFRAAACRRGWRAGAPNAHCEACSRAPPCGWATCATRSIVGPRRVWRRRPLMCSCRAWRSRHRALPHRRLGHRPPGACACAQRDHQDRGRRRRWCCCSAICVAKAAAGVPRPRCQRWTFEKALVESGQHGTRIVRASGVFQVALRPGGTAVSAAGKPFTAVFG